MEHSLRVSCRTILMSLVLLLLGFVSSQTRADNSFYQCMQSLQHDPALQAIRDKVSLSGGNENLFTQLSDGSYPTPSERNAIGAWGSRRQNCARSNGISDPGFDQAQVLIATLYKGSISYGEYAKQAQDLMRRIMEARQSNAPSPRYAPSQQSDNGPLYNPYRPPKPVTTRCRWDVLMRETVCETK